MAHNKQIGKYFSVIFSETCLCVCVVPLGVCWLKLGVLKVGEFTDSDNYVFRHSRSFYAN
jgi:hypothetical protein